MKYLSCFLLYLLLYSCSSPQVPRDVPSTPYQTSGVEKFFLPELPSWANGSASGQCFKKSSFQYLDFSKLHKAYQLDYEKLLELQAQYNERREKYFRSVTQRFLRPVEEASLFANTLENVRAGVKSFKLPQVAKKVDVIWLDQFIALNLVDEIRKMNQVGRFDERLPILFSSCMSKHVLNQWLVENKLDNIGFYLLTGEWLSPFGGELKLTPGLHIEVKKLLEKEVDIRFVSPRAILLPTEIVL